MKRVAAGAHLPTPWLFEPVKRPDDRADYRFEWLSSDPQLRLTGPQWSVLLAVKDMVVTYSTFSALTANAQFQPNGQPQLTGPVSLCSFCLNSYFRLSSMFPDYFFHFFFSSNPPYAFLEAVYLTATPTYTLSHCITCNV